MRGARLDSASHNIEAPAERFRYFDSVDHGLAPATTAVAHELLNELNVINSAVQILESELPGHIYDADIVSDSMRHIKTGIKRLASMIQEFHHGTNLRLKLRSTELTSVIDEILRIEGRHYAARGIHVRTAFGRKLPRIMLDPLKFRQVMLNLCKNAYEAMPNGGTLTLRAYRTTSYVHVAVIDTGEGIPRGINPFTPFATTKATGTGVGLAVVRQIIQRHGGTISYASRPKRGTIFRFALPLGGMERGA
jgi:signal transduction histidine kinase